MNNNSHTYKQHLIWVLIGIPLLFIIVYKFSVKKTFKEVNQYKQLSEIASSGQDEQIISLKTEIAKYDMAVNKTLNKTLLDIISQYTIEFNLKITDFVPPDVIERNDLSVTTQKVVVKGNYTAMLKMIYQLEEKENLNLTSVNFKKTRNKKTKKDELFSTFYIQKINQNEKN